MQGNTAAVIVAELKSGNKDFFSLSPIYHLSCAPMLMLVMLEYGAFWSVNQRGIRGMVYLGLRIRGVSGVYVLSRVRDREEEGL